MCPPKELPSKITLFKFLNLTKSSKKSEKAVTLVSFRGKIKRLQMSDWLYQVRIRVSERLSESLRSGRHTDLANDLDSLLLGS